MTGYAWTSDEEIERGAAEVRRLWPDMWAAWVRFCDGYDDRPSDRNPLQRGDEMADKALGVGAKCCGEGAACELDGCTGTPATTDFRFSAEAVEIDEDDE